MSKLLIYVATAVLLVGCATTPSIEQAAQAEPSQVSTMIEKAEAGDAAAVDWLIVHYDERNTLLYRKWMERKALSGDIDAVLRIAEIYYNDYQYGKAQEYLGNQGLVGDPKAAALLGMLHYRGLHSEPSLTKAHELFMQAAQQDNPLAMAALGFLYMEEPSIVGTNSLMMAYEKAYDYLAKGMEADEPLAVAGMATLLAKQDDLPGAYKMAQQVRSRYDDAYAGSRVIRYFLNGNGGRVNLSAAKALIRDGRRAKSVIAYYWGYLGHADGLFGTAGNPKNDYEKASSRLAALANAGSTAAKIDYVRLVDSAFGRKHIETRPAPYDQWMSEIKSTTDGATYLAAISAANGNFDKAHELLRNVDRSSTQYHRASLYIDWKQNGITASNAEAISKRARHESWAAEAVSMQFGIGQDLKPGLVSEEDGIEATEKLASRNDVGAMNNLSIYHERAGDERQAFRWAKKAADAGSPNMMAIVGNAYHDGNGTGVSKKRAVDYYRKAHAINYEEGTYWYAESLVTGDGVTHDPRKAYHILLKLARKNEGHWAARAYAELALLATNGVPNFINRNPIEAAGLMLNSAELGYVNAQVALAEMYRKGIGVPRNRDEAYRWMKMAADNGDSRAKAQIAGMKPPSQPRYTIATPTPKPRSLPPAKRYIPGSGSGWVSEHGYVVTNHHVIDGASRVFGYIGNETPEIEFRVVDVDEVNDVALLEPVSGALRRKGLKLSTTDSLVGSDILAFGYPLVDQLGVDPKVTSGIVSSKSGLRGNQGEYQISNPIQSGNSGGPVVDDNGVVVGIVTSQFIGAKRVQNVNYATKASKIRALIDKNRPSLKDEVPAPSTGEKSAIVTSVLPSLVLLLTQ